MLFTFIINYFKYTYRWKAAKGENVRILQDEPDEQGPTYTIKSNDALETAYYLWAFALLQVSGVDLILISLINLSLSTCCIHTLSACRLFPIISHISASHIVSFAH